MIDLDKLEELEKQTTEGPFVASYNMVFQRDHSREGELVDVAEFCEHRRQNKENAKFFATMRNSLPALIAELRAARNVVAAATIVVNWIPCDECPTSSHAQLHDLYATLNAYDQEVGNE